MTNNIFGSGANKNQSEFNEKVDIHSKAILTVVERQKDLESTVDLLNEKLELLDHNTIKNIKKLFSEIKLVKDDLRDLKHDIETVKDQNMKIAKQLRLMGTKDEIAKLEKYIDLWDPMNFVSREELEQSQKKTIEELRKIIEGFMK